MENTTLWEKLLENCGLFCNVLTEGNTLNIHINAKVKIAYIIINNESCQMIKMHVLPLR